VYLVTKGALVPEMAAQGLLDSTSFLPSTGATAAGGSAGSSSPARSSEPTIDATAAAEQSDGPDQFTEPGQADLATLNARLGLLASLSGFVFAIPAVIALKLGGAPWVVWLALVVFLAGAVAGLRLPVRRSRSIRGAPAGPEPGSAVGSTGADLVVASSEHPTAPMVGRQPFIEDLDDDEDLAPFRPIANGEVLLALVPMSALKALVGFLTFLFAFGLRREGAATWWFGLLLGSITAGALVGVLLVSRIRRLLSEQQILVASLWLVAVFAAVGTIERARLLQTVVAFAVGVAGAIAKPSFDALVQQFVPESNQGRAFARFETRLQLVWVVGAFVPVVLTLPIPAGDLVMAIFAAVTGIFYMSGRRSIRDRA
jgi:hypothetical protein